MPTITAPPAAPILASMDPRYIRLQSYISNMVQDRLKTDPGLPLDRMTQYIAGTLAASGKEYAKMMQIPDTLIPADAADPSGKTFITEQIEPQFRTKIRGAYSRIVFVRENQEPTNTFLLSSGSRSNVISVIPAPPNATRTLADNIYNYMLAIEVRHHYTAAARMQKAS